MRSSFLRFLILIFLLGGREIRAQVATFSVTPVGADRFLTTPWDLHYGPDDFLWVTERVDGVVLRVDPETGTRDEVVRIAEVYSDASQDGLLGLALHDEFMGDSAFVYLSYSYLDGGARRQKLVRYTYTITMGDGTLSDPVTLLSGLPASNDHNSGRLVFGPDKKLYYTIGDQGGNQGKNYCAPILAQVLPTREKVAVQDWSNYPGKILRLNTDGSIPEDNPLFEGVRSHVFTYGHRNPQGLAFGRGGILYADEHGPSTDDEVNLIAAGGNYGWPEVAGYRDDQAYAYCDWSTVANCADLEYDIDKCPEGASLRQESSFTSPDYREPLLSMFAVADDYDFNGPGCQDDWVCRPNVAPSSLAYYDSDALPGWKNSLLVVSLKRGRVYRLQLDEAGTAIVGDTTEYFYTHNRYRDLVVAPDGKTFYAITDGSGRMTSRSGLQTIRDLDNPGNILKFTLEPTVAVADPAPAIPFGVRPNPVSGRLHIDLSAGPGETFRGELLSAGGQVVRKLSGLRAGTNELDTGGLSAGVYVLRLFGRGHAWQRRVIVQRN